MNEHINDIKKVLMRYNRYYYTYTPIDNELSIKKIYSLLVDNNIYEPSNVTEMIYLGYYYEEIEKDDDLMKKYYRMASDEGNLYSMNHLGCHYKNVEKDYDLMKKYFLIAIDKGHLRAMTNLEIYYKKNNLFVEKIIDFHQHDVKITEKHIVEMFTKCKMIDDKLMNLIMTVDLRSYKNCPEHIKSMQNNYIQNVRNELNACHECPKELVNLTIDFIMTCKK